MASTQKSQKTSRWGFLQQAVASVESRLDTILAEDDETPKRALPSSAQPAKDKPVSNRPSTEISRSGASTPGNDRLQARLAQAMVKKNAGRNESPAPVQVETSETDRTSLERQSLDVEKMAVEDNITPKPNDNAPVTEAVGDAQVPSSAKASLEVPPHNLESSKCSSEAPKLSLTTSSARASADSVDTADPTQLHSHLEAAASRQKLQDELNEHVERIDALQAKLKFLSIEAANSAKKTATEAEAGSTEKRLAEKDEKIALLLQEGTALQKIEMKLRQALKKAQTDARANDKANTDVRQRAEKAERDSRILEDRVRRAEAAAKRAEQTLATSTQASSGLEAITRERDALKNTLAEIKAQLLRANARADAAESKAANDLLEKERKKTAELQDDLTSAKVERELSEEKLRREIKDLKASLEREKEQTRAMETEMLGEQATLESKLESFRARAEEASSSDHGDVRAKLLRQIETLQSQYAAASQNWQGIEASLLGRITNLEKERDEVVTRESDVRRKLRDTSSKLKRAERDLEDAQNRLPDIEKELGQAEEEAQRLQKKIKQLEADLAQARSDVEEQKAQAEKDTAQRIEEEKSKWAATLQFQTQRNDSPAGPHRRTSGLGVDPYDRSSSRRASVFPSMDTPSRQQSFPSLKGLSNGGIPETPSIVTSQDHDEYFNNVPPTPASQSHANSPRAIHDLVSTSTVGAGPSVQLVERMSANVRRLESEKAASKDELVRLTTQRDESRQEVVNLMREVEEKRTVANRLAVVEEEHKALSQRHQTTLELLGEKSEQVEELKADILDVKQMYRQLADTMGK